MIEALSDEDKNSKIKLSLAKAYSHMDEFDKTQRFQKVLKIVKVILLYGTIVWDIHITIR